MSPQQSRKQAQKKYTRTTLALAAGSVILFSTAFVIWKTQHNRKAGPQVSATQIENYLGKDGASPARPKLDSVDVMTQRLADRLAKQPDDDEGWRMLGWSYFHMGDYDKSAKAYSRAVALVPDNADYLSAYGEALIKSNDDRVGEDAMRILDKALAIKPQDMRARYYKAQWLDENGKTDEALAIWRTLLAEAPGEADWAKDLQNRINARTGKPSEPASGPSTTTAPAHKKSGPTPEDIKAAQNMPAQDRQAMINGMVNRLATRLKNNPDDAEGWLRLIRSRTVLQQNAQAKADLMSALKAFEGKPEIQSRLRTEARKLGVTVQ